MKKVNERVYIGLKPEQRLFACLEADARGDEVERERLFRTCPRYNYRQPDQRFADAKQNLYGLALAVECDLRGYELMFTLALRVAPQNAMQFLQQFSDTRSAWRSALAKRGFDPTIVERAGPPRPAAAELLEPLVPEPDPVRSLELADRLCEMLDSFEP